MGKLIASLFFFSLFMGIKAQSKYINYADSTLIEEYDFSTNTWNLTSKSIYENSNIHYRLSSTHYILNQNTLTWSPQHRFTYIYNEFNTITEIQTWSFSQDKNTFILAGHDIYEYDSLRRLSYATSEQWVDSTQTWKSSNGEVIYSYDSNTVVIESKAYYLNTYLVKMKSILFFNEDQLDTLRKEYQWYPTDTGWVKVADIQHIFDEDGNLIEEIFDYGSRVLYEYDSNGNNILKTQLGHKTDIEIWDTLSKTEYQFDIYNTRTILHGYTWSDELNDWESTTYLRYTNYYGEEETVLDNSEQERIVLFPNPVVDELHIALPENMSEAELIMYNIHGVVVKRLGVEDSTIIPVSDLETGMYTISIFFGKNLLSKCFFKN